MNNSDFYNDARMKSKPSRFLKLTCLFLWVFAAQQCLWIYLKPSPARYEIALAVAYVMGAAGINLLSLWASKKGRLKNFRVQGTSRCIAKIRREV